ncbi:MAG: GTPase, partial [Euryarchaeota archaeon CG_4_9_14_3_um_filter_38_12]
VSSIRHPMPYDPDLTKQVCERFASYDNLDKYNCTIEEREEYEPYIEMGGVVYAGVDYEKILRKAEE